MSSISSAIELEKIHQLSSKLDSVRVMEFCGGHTHALVRSGLMELLPKNIKMVHGPGCPVCVLPPNHIQAVLDLLKTKPELSVMVYGDLMRIPTLQGQSLLQARSQGASIQMIYSPLEIISHAEESKDRDFLFLAIGFETTAPATAILIKELEKRKLLNVSVLCLHVLTPPAIESVLNSLDPIERPQAVVGPGHVSLVTGIEIYSEFSKKYQMPIVVSGFEPQDLLESIRICLDLLTEKSFNVVNQYTRALRPGKQSISQKLLSDVFQVRESFEWRGLGKIPYSALELKPKWASWDAEKKFDIVYQSIAEHPACKCGEILRGRKTPKDCRVFGKACQPSQPLGACMVSSEGACSAYYQAGIL